MTLDPLGTLIDEARSEALRQHAGEVHGPGSRGEGPVPVLAFGEYGAADHEAVARKRRGLAIPASMLLHGAVAVAIAIVPILVVDSLPGETGGVRAFFVEPIAAPPPPPPPPPAPTRAAAARSAAPKTTVQAAGFVAPVEVPSEIKPEEGLDAGAEGGVPGGVEGGVPGGVVGGVVGGLPDAPPPPPAKPVRVGGDIREPRKVVDVAPVYPLIAAKAQLEGIVIIEATVGSNGRVESAKVLRGMPLLDEAALQAVRQWVYTPTLLNGVPTPIILTVTVTFRLRRE